MCLIVDLFAGGGGASTGIEMALGRPVDIAVNHDPEAVAMHQANHPHTAHYCENVWQVSPRELAAGRPVELLWLSPDCKHHSKAKGGKPVEKKIRGLAWVALRWIAQAPPKIIMLENVEEFADWGPLVTDEHGHSFPCKQRKGETFKIFVNALRKRGYAVQWRELRACDYGAPTIRKRLFLIARRDRLPIVWPEPTHADPKSEAVKKGRLLPWRTAAECLDFSLPCHSIFMSKEQARALRINRPLAEATLRRIAKGIMRYVINAPAPFIVNQAAQGLIHMGHGEQSANGHGRFSHGVRDIEEPLPTVTATDHNSLVTSNLVKLRGDNVGQPTAEPLATISAQGTHHAEVRAFLTKYYGIGEGQAVDDPMHTLTTLDRFGLVTVKGQLYQIEDIGLRMLQPRELYRAQGFPDSYIIGDDSSQGLKLTKTAQVRMVGNSVCPPIAAALVKANYVDSIALEKSA